MFTTLVLMTGITAAIPYGFSAAAQIKWRIADQKKMETARFARDMIVAVLSVVFSALFIYYSRDTGHSFWVYWAPFLLTIAAFLIGSRSTDPAHRMTAPAEVPPTVSQVRSSLPGEHPERAVVALGGNALLNAESRSRPPTRPARPASRRASSPGSTREPARRSPTATVRRWACWR